MSGFSLPGMTEPVTVLGLGPMGQAIAAAFAAGGHPTTVWTRSGRTGPAGTTRAADVEAAVTASKTVVVCLIDYAATRSVLEPAAEALRGRLVVNLTSGSPASARATAGWAAQHDITYVDGAIMTPIDTIGTEHAVILHSGPNTDVLGALGGTRTHLGADHGRAAAYDVALLDVFWTAVAGVTHAFALARREGIAATELAPLAKGIADLMPIVIDEHSRALENGDHNGDEANLSSAAAGMAHIVETATEHGIDAGVMRAALAVARRAIDAGHGGDGLSRLTVTLEEGI